MSEPENSKEVKTPSAEKSPSPGSAAPAAKVAEPAAPGEEEILHRDLFAELVAAGAISSAHAVDRSMEQFSTIEVKGEDLPAVLRHVKAKGHANLLDSITGIDRLQLDAAHPEYVGEGRFCLLYQLMSIPSGKAINLRVILPADAPSVPTIDEIFGNANWLEREVFDLFGIVFTGSRDLRRILLPPEWEGYPLRRDYVQGEFALGYPTTRPDPLAAEKAQFAELLSEGAE